MRTLSVVIANYNYGRFVRDAVNSALALDWPDLEVIVVDDGSTDDSRDVLRAFGTRIQLIMQENKGQREACNTGYRVCTGDAIVFLDSDDMLEPGLARAVASRWAPGVSKVQVQMLRVDELNNEVMTATPRFRFEPTPAQISHWVRTTTAYPTPPGSGNVYSREFLDRIMPLDERVGAFADSGCLAAAPLLGDVVTIARPLVRYRTHPSNDSHLLGAPGRFQREIGRAADRYRYAMEVTGGRFSPKVLRRSRELLQFRVADRRLRGGSPALAGDTLVRLLADSLLSPTRPGPESVRWRMVLMGWLLAVLILPRPFASRLISTRYRR